MTQQAKTSLAKRRTEETVALKGVCLGFPERCCGKGLFFHWSPSFCSRPLNEDHFSFCQRELCICFSVVSFHYPKSETNNISWSECTKHKTPGCAIQDIYMLLHILTGNVFSVKTLSVNYLDISCKNTVSANWQFSDVRKNSATHCEPFDQITQYFL